MWSIIQWSCGGNQVTTAGPVALVVGCELVIQVEWPPKSEIDRTTAMKMASHFYKDEIGPCESMLLGAPGHTTRSKDATRGLLALLLGTRNN